MREQPWVSWAHSNTMPPRLGDFGEHVMGKKNSSKPTCTISWNPISWFKWVHRYRNSVNTWITIIGGVIAIATAVGGIIFFSAGNHNNNNDGVSASGQQQASINVASEHPAISKYIHIEIEGIMAQTIDDAVRRRIDYSISVHVLRQDHNNLSPQEVLTVPPPLGPLMAGRLGVGNEQQNLELARKYRDELGKKGFDVVRYNHFVVNKSADPLKINIPIDDTTQIVTISIDDDFQTIDNFNVGYKTSLCLARMRGTEKDENRHFVAVVGNYSIEQEGKTDSLPKSP